MSEFWQIIIACFSITLVSLIGLVSLFMSKGLIEKFVTGIISFAAGTLTGAALFHLLPESIRRGGPTFIMIAVGICLLFVLELFIYTFERHTADKQSQNEKYREVNPLGILSLFGDGLHNATDGVIIASGFLIDTSLGVLITAVAMLHEVPQEIGNFAVLVNSGFSRSRALIFNYLSALMIFVGAIGFYYLSDAFTGATRYTIPFSAGAFIYIAIALLSEVKSAHSTTLRRLFQALMFTVGIVLLLLLKV